MPTPSYEPPKSEQVLDHGYVRYIEHWGSDERIIEAARMSTGKGFLGWGPTAVCTKCGGSEVVRDKEQDHPGIGTCAACGSTYLDDKPGDEKLLRYLYTHKHFTPFEMAGLTIEVQAPIFVFREWHRHRTQSYNEMSARYTPLPDVHYMPTIERCLMGGGKNKQAQPHQASAAEIDASQYTQWLYKLQEAYEHSERVYDLGLRLGIPKEVARLPVAVGRYSRMRAQAVLRNWLAFLTLRMDESAQWEIRQFANKVGTLIADKFPRTWGLYVEGGRK